CPRPLQRPCRIADRRSSRKHFPYFIEEAAFVLVRFGLEIGRIIQFLEHRFFFGGDVLWRPDIDMDQLVAPLVGVYARESLSFQPEDLAAVCTGRYLDLGFAVDGGYFRLETEYGIRKGDMELVGDVQTIPVEFGVLFLLDENDQIARRTAPFSGVASAANAQLHAFLYARRNFDGDGLFSVDAAVALADTAFGGDDRAFAITGRTGGDGLHLP